MRGKELLILSDLVQENLKSDYHSSKIKLGRFTHTKKGALQLVKEDKNNLKRLSTRLKNNQLVVMTSIENFPDSFKFAGVKAKNKIEIAKYAVDKYPKNITEVGNKIKADKVKNRELVKLALRKEGMLLKFLPEYQNDDEMVNIAVTNNSLSLKFANERFKKSEEFIYNHAIVRSFVLVNTDKELLKNRDFIKKIVSENPIALHTLPMYQNDLGVVETAILAMPDALRFASLQMRSNETLKKFIEKYDLKDAKPYLIEENNIDKTAKEAKKHRKIKENEEIENN